MESNQNEKTQINKKKINIRATVSPYLSENMGKLVEKGKFSSISDLISVAVTKLLTEYPEEDVKA